MQLHQGNTDQKWKKFKQKWNNYEIATGVAKKDKANTCRDSVIGNEAVDVYNTFTWGEEADEPKNEKSIGEVRVVLQPQEERFIRTLCFLLAKSRQW